MAPPAVHAVDLSTFFRLPTAAIRNTPHLIRQARAIPGTTNQRNKMQVRKVTCNRLGILGTTLSPQKTSTKIKSLLALCSISSHCLNSASPANHAMKIPSCRASCEPDHHRSSLHKAPFPEEENTPIHLRHKTRPPRLSHSQCRIWLPAVPPPKAPTAANIRR